MARLLDEIHISAHACDLDHIAELFLAPAPACFRPGAQGGRELLRFGTHIMGLLRQLADLARQRAAGFRLFLAKFVETFLVTRQGFADRL